MSCMYFRYFNYVRVCSLLVCISVISFQYILFILTKVKKYNVDIKDNNIQCYICQCKQYARFSFYIRIYLSLKCFVNHNAHINTPNNTYPIGRALL